MPVLGLTLTGDCFLVGPRGDHFSLPSEQLGAFVVLKIKIQEKHLQHEIESCIIHLGLSNYDSENPSVGPYLQSKFTYICQGWNNHTRVKLFFGFTTLAALPFFRQLQ